MLAYLRDVIIGFLENHPETMTKKKALCLENMACMTGHDWENKQQLNYRNKAKERKGGNLNTQSELLPRVG